MFNFLRNRLVLCIALIIFIIAKIPHLYYGFLGDESWVYGPGVILMYLHGPSLLPNAISAAYSRGHPLFFHSAFATWMRIFGNSTFSMHCFALVIALLLAIALYEIMLKLFNKKAALISVALLLLNIRFYAESSFVLNDIMVTLFVFLCLYFYTYEKYLLTSLFLTLLFLTKESGLVAGLVVGLDILFSIFKRNPIKVIGLKCIALFVPAVVMILFFIIQKKTQGWYLYPNHVTEINVGIENTLYNLQRSFTVIFYYEQMYYFPILLLMLIALAAWKQKKMKYLLFFIPAIIMYFSIFKFSFKEPLFYVSTTLFIVALIILFFKKIAQFNPIQERFIKLTTAFCICYIYFCTVNYFEYRYLFPAMFLISIVLMSVSYDFFISRLWKGSFNFIWILIICIGAFSYSIEGGEMRQYDHMYVQQQLIDYFEKNNWYDKKICSQPFVDEIHLKDPKTGFLHSDRVFKNVDHELTNDMEFVIFDNFEPNDLHDVVKKDSTFFLLHRFEKANAWIEVYRRK
jgi:Dolichyl-phosphate-mannose-protein mannosyltransferase